MTTFVLDTNVISDIVAPQPNTTVLHHLANQRQQAICLCAAIDYEIRRGYLKTKAVRRLLVYDQRIRPQFQWIPVIEADWRQAAQFWAETVMRGKQLADVDLLLAAVAHRLGGIIVSADDDFDALPVTRQNWRLP